MTACRPTASRYFPGPAGARHSHADRRRRSLGRFRPGRVVLSAAGPGPARAGPLGRRGRHRHRERTRIARARQVPGHLPAATSTASATRRPRTSSSWKNGSQAGGGLVILPGDQIDEQFFNDHYCRDGAGLSPLKLESDPRRRDGKNLGHAPGRERQSRSAQGFAGQNNPLLDNVKVFRWWGAAVKKEQLGKEVSVAARFSDVEDSPAIAEKAFGKGRVVAIAIPADADWHNWTSDPSYLIVDAGAGAVPVGRSRRSGPAHGRRADPPAARSDAVRARRVAQPGPTSGRRTCRQPCRSRQQAARATRPSRAARPSSETVWQLEYPDTRHARAFTS